MMTTRASRVLKVLVFSLVVAAISRGEAAMAATLPVVTGQGAIEQALRTPTALALGTGGALYVADPANQGVLKFSATGKLTQKVSVKGIPQGVAVTADGRLLVSLKESVSIHNAAGTEIGKLGAGVGQFMRASQIALDDTGLIYVTDSKGACVQVFTSGGAYLSRFGVKGSGDGQFRFPTSIAFEKISRQIAVVDSLNGRIQFYDLSGAFVRSIGAQGTGPIKFMHPQGVTFEYGASGAIRMYISDAMVRKVQVIDPVGAGQFISYLDDPRNGHVLPSELVFDQTSHRLYMVNGLGGITYYQIADGSVVVNSVTSPATGNATVLASTAQSATGAVTLTPHSTVAPYNLSAVADGSSVTGSLLDVTGLVSARATVAVNGQPVAVVNGLFSTAVPTLPGVNTIALTVTDAAGKSWKELRTVTRDDAGPLMTIASADVQVTDRAVLNLAGTVGRGVVVFVAGAPADLNNLGWSSTVTLTPGLNTVEIQAIDLVGQVSTQKRTVFYKAAGPELAITTPAEDLLTTKKRVVFKGAVLAAADTMITAAVNGIPVKVTVAAGQVSLPVEFSQEGAYTITLSATVAGGEVSSVSRTVVYHAVQ